MGITRFPHGILATPNLGGGGSYGMAYLSTSYFVDGVNGQTGNTGLDPENAVATIAEAISLADAWDVIYIAPKGWTSLPYSYPGLATAYAESNSIAYAKMGLAMVGIGHQGFAGIPHGVVIRETASAATANLKCYAPLCAFENLAFERASSETGGQLVFQGGTAITYEACGATVYNCYFFYANGTTGPGGWGGAIMSDQIWGLTVRNSYFLGCRGGIAFQSGGATSGSLIVQNNIFASRTHAAASEIDFDVFVYTQGAANCVIVDNHFAHLIPSLSGGGALRWVYITGDVNQGFVGNNQCGGAVGTTYTQGYGGTGIQVPTDVGLGANYCNGQLMPVVAV